MARRTDEVARPWIDTGEFARRGSALSATQPAASLPRLREMLASGAGAIAWQLAGSRVARPEGGFDLFLRLRLTGEVELACTRCLRPVRATLDEDRLFKLALTETQAEREDAQADEYDVLAGSPRFDVLELVEDEAIMALPIAPRHTDCRLPETAGDPTAEPREAAPSRASPFAVLGRLRRAEDGEGSDEGEADDGGGAVR